MKLFRRFRFLGVRTTPSENETLIKNRKRIDYKQKKKSKLESETMKRGRPRLEDYKTRTKANDPNKIKFNNFIKSFVDETPIVKQGSAVVLDAKTMLSLKALTSRGFPQKKIDSVNHTDATYKAILRKHKQSFHMSLGDYLSMVSEVDEVKYSMSVVVADYCCSLTGNDGSRPIEDMKKIFNNRLLGSPSLLATTFSWRTSAHKNYGSFIALLKLITKLAKENGYTYETYDGESYTGMFYLLSKLTRKDAKKPKVLGEESHIREVKKGRIVPRPFEPAWHDNIAETTNPTHDKNYISRVFYKKQFTRLTAGQKAHVSRLYNKQ